jgi:hypothetical protein
MQITNIRKTKDSRQTTLMADVYPKGRKDCFTLWFKVENRFAKLLSVNGDPFIAGLLLESMWQEEPLEIDALVSARLLNNIPELLAYYQMGEPLLKIIPVKAKPKEHKKGGELVGCFFSGGVDSFFSYFHNRQKYKNDQHHQINHIFLVRGFDIPLDSSSDALWQETVRAVASVAKSFKLELVILQTNIREIIHNKTLRKNVYPPDFWGISQHGSALCAVGLLFAGKFNQIYIPATSTYSSLEPRGTHPLTDPLWSTEKLTFIHDGCYASRVNKLKVISKSKVVRRTLRVCWENPNNEYNCGRCEKCLRTMLALQMLGKLNRCSTFPNKTNEEDLKKININSNVLQELWNEMLIDAQSLGKPQYAKLISDLVNG